MRKIRAWFIRLAGLFNKARRDRELAEEIESHLQLHVEDNLRRGMTPQEARRQALVKLGGVEQAKELYRRQRGLPWMETSWQDLRYGFRMLRKKPAFTVVAVLTVALGVGANTAIFTVVNAVLFRPLPVEKPEELVFIWDQNLPQGFSKFAVTFPNFQDWKERNTVLESMALYTATNFSLTGEDEPERLSGARTSAEFFHMLRAQPLVGRTFLPEEEITGRDGVVVLSYNFWQARYGGEANILQRVITLNGVPRQVIGVMPPDFRFPSYANVWAPLAFDPQNPPGRGAHFLAAMGRLKHGVSLEQARAEMSGIAGRLAEEYPQNNKDWGVIVVPVHEEVVGEIRPVLMILWGAVILVLLVSCVNLAGVLLARGETRRRELSVRLAIGAGRGRLVRQLLTETLLLFGGGGIVSLLVVLWGVDALQTWFAGQLPRASEIRVDFAVLAYTAGLTMACGLLFGLLPAWRFSRIDVHEALQGAVRETGDRRGHGILRALVAAEVTLATMLLVGAGLLVQSMVRLLDVDPGLRTDNILTMRIQLPDANYPDDPAQRRFYRAVMERISATPGVQSAGAIQTLPLSGSDWSHGFQIVGLLEPPPGEKPSAEYSNVTYSYFPTMGLRLVRGRFFTEQDHENAPRVAIVNETMVKTHFAGHDPLGQKIIIGNGIPEPREVVGVVADIKQYRLDRGVRPTIYEPHAQNPFGSMTVVVRTERDPVAMAGTLRSQVWAVDKDLPVFAFRTMKEVIAASTVQRRVTTQLIALFAAVALSLALIGLYGVISYSVAQRTREIGVRIALGATRGAVLRMVLRSGATLTLLGVVLGLGGALGAGRLLQGLLFEIQPTDAVTFAGAALLLAGVALLACCVPALRATRVDPSTALRCE